MIFLLFALSVVYGDGNPCRAISSGRNDVVYLAPATEPYEALPLGNGRLGVMVRNAPGLNYIFNHSSFFANSTQDNDLISSGEFTLQLPEAWCMGFADQRLVLHDAIIVTRYKTGTDIHTVKSWLAEGLDLLVVEIESTAALPDLTASLSIWNRKSKDYERIGVSGEIAEIAGLKASCANDGIHLATVGVGGHRATAMAACVMGRETKPSAEDLQATMKIPANGASRLTLLVACPVVIAEKQTLESVAKAAREVVASAPENGIVGLWRDHIAYWHEFWTKSGVVMHSDDGLADYIENLYHLQLYWMAACSRGPEAPKFNGGNFLFCKDWRSWGGYYWYQNTREMFWPLLAANHAELCAPLVDLYVRNLPAARKLAKDLFGARGPTSKRP